MKNKPFSQACENNKDPILSVLTQIWSTACEVLEVGSGTGQHAVHFATHLPHLRWQPSDRTENIPGMKTWFDEAQLDNIREPLVLDVKDAPWPVTKIENVFTANTLHIMSWKHVQIFFNRMGKYLMDAGEFVSYGPFNRHGQYTSDSNARFDIWLKQQDPVSAIRDMDALEDLARQYGIKLMDEIDMPANNKILIWQKSVRAGV